MATLYHGKDGNVKVGGTDVGQAFNWSLTVNTETADGSQFGTDWQDFVIGFRNWDGSMDAHWDFSDSGQSALQSAVLGGSPSKVDLELIVNSSGNSFTGSAIITSMNPGTPHDDIVDVSFDFQGTGTLSYS